MSVDIIFISRLVRDRNDHDHVVLDDEEDGIRNRWSSRRRTSMPRHVAHASVSGCAPAQVDGCPRGSGDVLSGSPERAASRTAVAVPSPRGVVPFFLDMFDNVITFRLALDCHFDQEARLSHVGTEGRGRLLPSTTKDASLRSRAARRAAPVPDVACARRWSHLRQVQAPVVTAARPPPGGPSQRHRPWQDEEALH